MAAQDGEVYQEAQRAQMRAANQPKKSLIFSEALDAEPVLRGSLNESGPELPEPERESSAEPMLYCPVCSTHLQQSRCKLVCGRCGYFMSCADYY